MAYSGRGIKKTAGRALTALSVFGALGGLSPQNTLEENLHSVIGGIVGGLAGHYLAGSGKRRKPHPIKQHHVKTMDQMMRSKKKIHISDIIPDPKKRAALLKKLSAHKQRLQSGEGIFGDIAKGVKSAAKKVGSVAHKATHELERFAAGKTSFKPSTLMNYLGSAVGVAGAASAFIPGIDLISVPAASAASLGLKSAALGLKTSGRGYGSGLNLTGIIPQKYHAMIRRNPMESLKLLKHLHKKKGSGLKTTGSGIISDLSLVGLTATATATGLYQYLKRNPDKIIKLMQMMGEKTISGAVAASQGSGVSVPGGRQPPKHQPRSRGHGLKRAGDGLTLSGQGLKTPGGRRMKRRGSRHEVMSGGALMTSGGLKKSDLVMDKGKIKSRRKMARGKQMYDRYLKK